MFFYRPNFIHKTTLSQIKRSLPHCQLAAYNNDDPFSKKYPKHVWKRYLDAIKSYDYVFAYRPSNVSQYKALGCQQTFLLPPWFQIERLEVAPQLEYDYDVVFVGHYEADNRAELIRSLANQNEFSFGLFGPDWSKSVLRKHRLYKLHPVRYLHGDDYFNLLCRSKSASPFTLH